MVAYAYYPTDTRIRREAEALVARGDTVDVIGLRKEGKKRIDTLNGVRMIQLSVARYRGANAAMYLLMYFQFLIKAFFHLTFLHLKQPYQVIQAHTMPDFIVFAAIVPKLLGTKVVLDVHDLMPELYRSKFGLPASHWLIQFITWMERRSIAFAHRAIAVHKPHLEALVSHGNPAEKFIILLNSPDPRIFSRQARVHSNGEGFKLIYHGTVAQRHGLSVALQALVDLKEKINGLQLQIFGDGDDLPHLIDLTKELDLADHVSIHRGFVPMEDLVPIILEADVGIVPILYDDFTKYMLPGKLLEYIALGIPVVSSRTGTIEAYFSDAMLQYVQPGNADDLAQKILEIYQNPAKRARLVANANKFNRDLGWDQQKKMYYRMVDTLIYGN
jgi:glycosyltransferase involved in cell wall biosynthesis